MPGTLLQTDADYAAWVERMIRSHPAPHAPTSLFACGSLIWKPDFEHVGETVGDARGWHRSFCFHLPRFRGTPEQPGLMMAMDRGGRCRGVLFELLPHDLPAQLDRLFRREFTVKPQSNLPRWITVTTDAGPRPALAFVMNRSSPAYAGRLPLETVADTLSRSCGHWGTGAEYLLNTVTQLEARGIRDRNLWILQRLVAERIERDHARAGPRGEDAALPQGSDAPTPEN
jgi:cation transport protein ChaC